jgi:eukaryotic-like serine/threonine-protein kinase
MPHPQHLGRYTVKSIISHGANNTLYKAFDPKDERFVSIKTISLEKLNSPAKKQLIASLIWEHRTTIDLDHPNIVKYYELVNDGGIPSIVMEYLSNKTLKYWLENSPQFSVNQGLEILKQLLCALDHIHKYRITHRDIKPGNIFYSDNGQIKITDFGISYPIGKIPAQIDYVQGTPAYMSPEQIICSQNSQHTDIFSAGVILYELLCGQKPFYGAEQKSIIQQILTKQPTTPSKINTDIPKTLSSIMLKALAKKPGERFESAAEFGRALSACL